MSGPAVLAAGTVNADIVTRVDALLAPGASLIAERLLRTSGGRAGNVSVMARRLGTPARLFGCVGDDDLAGQAIAGPAAAGVDLAGVRRVHQTTGLATIIVGKAGSKTMVMAPGANDAFAERDGECLAAALREAAEGSVLVVDTEVAPLALELALEAARDSGRPTVLDPTRPGRVTQRLLELADHITPNAEEAAELTGITVESPAEAHRAARRLHERGPRHVHVRLRRGGCITVWPDGEALLQAPEELDVIDTTGAGDAFAATLATAVIARLPPVDAARLAVAAAACAVTGFGAQESYPEPALLHGMARRVRASIYPRAALRSSSS